jgi:hypothetical protein
MREPENPAMEIRGFPPISQRARNGWGTQSAGSWSGFRIKQCIGGAQNGIGLDGEQAGFRSV